MAKTNTTQDPAPAHIEVLNALLDLKGAIYLSREAVFHQMGTNDTLVAADGVLSIAETELDRIYSMVESVAKALSWPTSIAEVAHA